MSCAGVGERMLRLTRCDQKTTTACIYAGADVSVFIDLNCCDVRLNATVAGMAMAEDNSII